MIPRGKYSSKGAQQFEVIEQDLKICNRSNIPEEAVHLLHLQLKGICVEGSSSSNELVNGAPFRDIHLKFPNSSLNGIHSVPRKVPVVPYGHSPYIFKDHSLYYGNEQVFPPGSVSEVRLTERDEPRYLKGYSFPFLGTANPYYELRINPKNTGKCPGRCSFCH